MAKQPKAKKQRLEKEIVSTCVKISACSNKFDQQEKWSDLVSKLEQLSKEGAVSDQSDYFHWKLWALAKSTNASFVQLVKENSHLRLKAA